MKRKEQWNAEEKESVFALLSYLGCDEKQRWERKRIKMETVDIKKERRKGKKHLRWLIRITTVAKCI